jgi:hypothetical protein
MTIQEVLQLPAGPDLDARIGRAIGYAPTLVEINSA